MKNAYYGIFFECYKEKKWPRRPEGISIEFTSFDKSKVIIE